MDGTQAIGLIAALILAFGLGALIGSHKPSQGEATLVLLVGVALAAVTAILFFT